MMGMLGEQVLGRSPAPQLEAVSRLMLTPERLPSIKYKVIPF